MLRALALLLGCALWVSPAHAQLLDMANPVGGSAPTSIDANIITGTITNPVSSSSVTASQFNTAQVVATGVSSSNITATYVTAGTVSASLVSATVYRASIGTAGNVSFGSFDNVGMYTNGGALRLSVVGDTAQFGSSYSNFARNVGFGMGISAQPNAMVQVSGTFLVGTGLTNPPLYVTASTVGIGVGSPSATLHVSGSMIIPICKPSIACTANTIGQLCWSTVQNVLATCASPGNYSRTTSNTVLVSGSSL